MSLVNRPLNSMPVGNEPAQLDRPAYWSRQDRGPVFVRRRDDQPEPTTEDRLDALDAAVDGVIEQVASVDAKADAHFAEICSQLRGMLTEVRALGHRLDTYIAREDEARKGAEDLA